MPKDKRETTIQHRLRWWREERAGVSLRKLQELLNEALPEEHRISFNTLANYERPEPSGDFSQVKGKPVLALECAGPFTRLFLGEQDVGWAGRHEHRVCGSNAEERLTSAEYRQECL